MKEGQILDRHATNIELVAQFKAQIASGKPFVIAISEPKESPKNGEMYQQLYVGQNIDRPSRPNGPLSTSGAIEAMFLGWDDKQIVRAVQNTTPDNVERLGLEQGSYLPRGINIMVVETTSPSYEGQSPKIFPESSDRSGEVITSMGKPVFVNTTLVPKMVTKDDHITLPYDHQNERAASAEEVETDVFAHVKNV